MDERTPISGAERTAGTPAAALRLRDARIGPQIAAPGRRGGAAAPTKGRNMVRNLLRGLALGLGLLGAIGTANAADELAYFREQLAPFTKKPAFVPPGPAFNARQCMKGKSIFSIPVSSANPFTANIEKAMAASANQVGFKFISWENQGQNSQWVQGMNAAINQNVSLIDLLGGTDPRTLVPQVMEARA